MHDYFYEFKYFLRQAINRRKRIIFVFYLTGMSIQGLQITKEVIRYVFPKEIRLIAEFVRVYEIKKKLREFFK
jgi:hypothetical protein